MDMNWFPSASVDIKRVGYHGFLSMILMLWKMNRQAKLLGSKHKVEITFPFRWFR